MQTLQLARNVWRLNSQISQDGTFVHYPFFCIEHSFVYFLLSDFFPLSVCFDILWQLATTHARDNTRYRDANSSRQNDVTWCDFFAGETSRALALSLAFPAENIKIYRSRFALVKKNWTRLVGKSTSAPTSLPFISNLWRNSVDINVQLSNYYKSIKKTTACLSTS